MARRIAPAQQPAPDSPFASQAAEARTAQVAAPSLPGGASGILPNASTKIHFAGEVAAFAGRSEESQDAPKPRRFVVFDCPKPPAGPQGFRVLLGGCVSYMMDGKIVDTNAYDVEMLETQGVKLRELDLEVPKNKGKKAPKAKEPEDPADASVEG